MGYSNASPLQRGDSWTADNSPVLVLLDPAADRASIHGDTNLLGLTLARRAARAARRAGYAKTIVLGAGGGSADAGPDLDRVPGWGSPDWDAMMLQGSRRIVVAPAQAVAETAWLAAAAAVETPASGWVALPGRLAVIDARTSLADLALDLGTLERQLSERLGAPGDGLRRADVLVLRDSGDLPDARKRLLRALAKDSDGFMARHVERPISIAMSRWLAETPITPNQITIVSGAIGVAAAPFFLLASPLWQTVGALLFLAHSIIDGCDGELARLKFQESRWGGVLDFWADNIVHLAIFTCMAVGWAEAEISSWPLVLGVTAILGAGGSAGFVHWRTMRGKSGEGPLFTGVSTAGGATGRETLARFLDGAGGRDFVYLVLALAMFGKSSWFMVLAGVGSPIYLLLLIVLAWREDSRSPAQRTPAQLAPSQLTPSLSGKGTVAPAAPLET